MAVHLITVSALILAVLLVRAVFRKKVPARLIYALWLVVAVKLCMPFSLFAVELPSASEASQTEQTVVQTQNVPAVTNVTEVLTPIAPITPIVPQQPTVSQQTVTQPSEPIAPTVTEPAIIEPIETEVVAPETPTVVETAPIDWAHIAKVVWLVGSTVMAVWFAVSGTVFHQRLCADRRLHTTVGRTKVYVSKSAGAPCLAGIVPAIYLTPDAANSPSEHFVITHEYTHLRHGDHIWSALRTASLIVYWWNPPVWAAAMVSKQDAELACDEAVAAKLDDSQRLAYAHTILDTIPQKHAHAVGLGSAPIKERILMLTKRHQNRVVAAILAVVLTLSAVGCSFIGPKATTEPVDDTPDLPSSITTAEQSDMPMVTTTEKIVENVPDPTEDFVRVLSNEGNLDIHTVLLPLENADMRYLAFAYDDRYSIYLTRNGQQYADLYIVDAKNGEIVYTYALDVNAYYFYIAYTDAGCIVYGKNYDTVSCAYAVTDTDGVFSVTPIRMAAYPIAEQRFVSPSGTYTAYETVDDAGADGGIDIRYPNGSEKRILEKIMLEETDDISGVTGYHPIGFVSDTELVYRIGGWEGTKGYGIYDVATGEKTEVVAHGDSPCAVYDGAFYVEEWDNSMIVYEPTAIWKVTADGVKTKIASKDAADSVYVLSDDKYREFEHSMWCIFGTGNAAGIGYGEDTPENLTVALYSPDLDQKLAEIEYPHNYNAFDNVIAYENSVTVVVPYFAEEQTGIETPMASLPTDLVKLLDTNVAMIRLNTQYGELKLSYSEHGSGMPVYSIENAPGVLVQFYAWDMHTPLAERMIPDEVILDKNYTGAPNGLTVGKNIEDCTSLIAWEDASYELINGVAYVQTTIGAYTLTARMVTDQPGQWNLPDESTATDAEWDAWQNAYRQNPTGEIVELRIQKVVREQTVPEDTNAPSSAAQTLTDSVTYIDIGGAYVPVSYIQDGKQLLTGDAVYSSLAEDILKDAPKADSLQKQNNLASNATGHLFSTDVEHTSYTPENQPEVREWSEYFTEKLASQNTPVIITEAWSFTLDGRKAAIVVASNVTVSGDANALYMAGDAHVASNPPAADSTVLYRMQAIFVAGSEPQDLYSESFTVRSGADAGNAGVSYLSFATESYQQIFSAWQYDASGRIVECPIFHNMSGGYQIRDYAYSPEYTVCDIDGDGAAEVICYNEKASSAMSLCTVYQAENGELAKVFSLVPN